MLWFDSSFVEWVWTLLWFSGQNIRWRHSTVSSFGAENLNNVSSDLSPFPSDSVAVCCCDRLKRVLCWEFVAVNSSSTVNSITGNMWQVPTTQEKFSKRSMLKCQFKNAKKGRICLQPFFLLLQIRKSSDALLKINCFLFCKNRHSVNESDISQCKNIVIWKQWWVWKNAVYIFSCKWSPQQSP
jgi:hypothetical protein